MKKEKYEKKEVHVISYQLDSDTEYSLDKIKEIAEKAILDYPTFYPLNPFMELISHYRIEAHKEDEPYSDYSYTIFNIIFYRMEIDEEFKDRVKKEEEKKAKAKEYALNQANKEREKKEKEEALLKNPEYQQFLELKKKFK